jgi:hypothetical protein
LTIAIVEPFRVTSALRHRAGRFRSVEWPSELASDSPAHAVRLTLAGADESESSAQSFGDIDLRMWKSFNHLLPALKQDLEYVFFNISLVNNGNSYINEDIPRQMQK